MKVGGEDSAVLVGGNMTVVRYEDDGPVQAGVDSNDN